MTRATQICLTIRNRIVDHDGYCSGSENEPSVNVFTVHAPIPVGYTFDLGQVLGSELFSLFDISTYVEEVKECEGSYYCSKCTEWDDIDMHDNCADIVCAVAI